MKERESITLTHSVWNILIPEVILLVVIALLWRLTGWHTTVNYGSALATVGGIIIGAGLLSLAGGSRTDRVLEMQKRKSNSQDQFTSPYFERARLTGWLILFGAITVVIGVAFNIFIS